MIFGAKTDLEMREWMVAIKLMSDKLVRHPTSPPTPNHSGGAAGNLTPTQKSADAKFPSLPHRPENRGGALRKGDIVHRSTPLLLQQQQHDGGAGGHSSSSKNIKNALRQSDSLQCGGTSSGTCAGVDFY